MIVEIDPEIIPYDNLIRSLCTIPYHGHSKGCPNYGKKDGCPPQPMINDIYDFNQKMYVIVTEFPIGEFAEKMKDMHSEWKTATYPDKPQKALDRIDSTIEQLKDKHPDWPDSYFPEELPDAWESSRQWYNPRRWQGTARKNHKEELEHFLEEYGDDLSEVHPDANKLNVSGLLSLIGTETSINCINRLKESYGEIEEFLKTYDGPIIDRCPEAHGINITGLMSQLGVTLNWQWPPEHNLENKSYIVSVAGHLKH